MRHFAKQKGLSLSDQGLKHCTRVGRGMNREKVWEGPFECVYVESCLVAIAFLLFDSYSFLLA